MLLRVFRAASPDATNTPEAGADDRSPSLFVASTGEEARDGLIIDQSSWNLEAYNANPVVLWAHEDDLCPVGRGSARIEGGQLLVEVAWDWEDPLAAEVAGKVKRGFLNAVSVRWRPGELIPRWRLPQEDVLYAQDGYISRNNELLEVSIVSVPADPRALVIARSAGDAAIGPREIAQIARAEVERQIAALLPEATARAVADLQARALAAPAGDWEGWEAEEDWEGWK